MQVDLSVYLSLAFLFGIAAQFRAMDGYAFLRRVVASLEGRVGILAAVAIVTFAASPFVLNDVVVIILTPVVVKYGKQFNVDPAPLVAAELVFTNIASSITPFGNPQNIIIWAASGISVGAFVVGTLPRLAASTLLASIALVPLALRSGWKNDFPSSLGSLVPALYLGLVGAIIVLSDVLGAPPFVPLGLGFLIGFAFTFRSAGFVVKEFDLRALLTLYAFVTAVIVASYFLLSQFLPYVDPVVRGEQPYSGAFMALVSSVISNVPATQLVVSAGQVSSAHAPLLAVQAGLAGNLGPVASFANILALQISSKGGVSAKKIIAVQFVVGLVCYVPALL